MTLNQLVKETYLLGFEEPGELDNAFVFCANRAMRMIFLRLAAEKCAEISISAPDISFSLKSYVHTPNKKHTLSLTGKALSFRYSGNGEYTLKDKTKVSQGLLDSKLGEVKLFFENCAELELFSNTSFKIYDLCVFNSLLGSTIADIPLVSDSTRICLSEYIEDLMSITRLPEDSVGNEIKAATVSGDILELPSNFCGKIFVYYKPSPKAVDIDNRNIPIDIPKFAEHLLPILTASFLWLDDDPDKADYYMAIYNSEANRVMQSLPRKISAKYDDVTGWA